MKKLIFLSIALAYGSDSIELGKALYNEFKDYDINQIIVGIKEGKRCNRDLQDVMSNINLKKTNAFLKQNAQKNRVISLKGNKLQYIILKQGYGSKVKIENNFLLKLKGYFLDNTTFYKKNTSITSVMELPEALQDIVLDMKKFEKRKVFVHPSLDKNFSNLLLIYEIEILETDKAKLKNREIATNQVR